MSPEVIQAIIDGKSVEIYDTYKAKWVVINPHDNFRDFYNHLEYNFLGFLKAQFRIKPQKVKRYQAVYCTIQTPKIFSITPPTDKYINKEDFDSFVYNSHRKFMSLVQESEEEFDK